MEHKRMASRGLYDAVKKIVIKLYPDNASVIDLGSGDGALASVFPKKYLFDNIDREVDLNKKFFWSKTYDVVTCTEVIEHLYNPKKLLLDGHSLIKEGGHMIITTPHNQSLWSRLYFLFTGKFLMFDGSDWMATKGYEGHITPVFDWEMKVLCRGLFSIERISFNRGIIPLFGSFINHHYFGQNIIYTLRKVSS